MRFAASFSDVRGFGRGRSHGGDEEIVGAARRVWVDVMVNDLLAAAVESSIPGAGYTGGRGDGKVYVLPLASARHIGTGETDVEAI